MSQAASRNPPAFQLYADDFLAGTIHMTDEEVGCYMRMLCVQWNRGGVDKNKVCRMSNPDVVESVICEKFTACDDGLFRNSRLEEVRSVQQARSRAGSKGGAKAQAKRKQTLSKDEANGEAKVKPPSPSPSPSPNSLPTHTHGEQKEFLRSHVAIDLVWSDAWGKWLDSWETRMGKVFDPIQAEVQLMELTSKPAKKALSDLLFSLGKGSKSILDSDNDFSAPKQGKQKPRSIRL